MAYQRSELYFLFALLTGAFAITFFIFQPFLYSLILAAVFATVFDGVHRKILSYIPKREELAALLSTLAVLLAVVVPISFLTVQILREATQMYSFITSNGGAAGLTQDVANIAHGLGLSQAQIDSIDMSATLKGVLTWLIGNIGVVFSNIARIAIGLFVMLISLYYLFKEGDRIKKNVIALSPLQDIYDRAIFAKLANAINTVVKGSLTVGLVQGFVTTIGLIIFGVPNPFLWGSITVVAALIPGVGTSLVVVPAVLFLFFTGATNAAIGMALWGAVAVGLIDNILGPKLMQKGVEIHPFLILLSVLGGVGIFGPLGFLLGPLTLSLLFVFLEIYASMHKASV